MMFNFISIVQIILTMLFAPAPLASHSSAIDLQAEQCSGIYETQTAGNCVCIEGYIQDSQSKSCIKEAYLTVLKPENGLLINNVPDAFKISGSISNNCNEINVSYYSNDKLKDQYKLNKFNKGDVSFEYNISQSLKNIAEGENKYLVTAACEGKQIVTDSLKVQFFPNVVDEVIEQGLGFSNEDAYLTPTENLFVPIQPVSISTYTNKDSITVQSPTYYPTVPSNASAKCKDGTYSFSLNRRGTCSGHKGVSVWY